MTGDTFPADNDVGRSFDTGIGSAGQGFNSSRPNLLQYVIAFAHRFKALDDDGRLELLSDAWRFRRWLIGDDDDAEDFIWGCASAPAARRFRRRACCSWCPRSLGPWRVRTSPSRRGETGPDEAGGPPPTKFYRRRDNVARWV